MRAADRARAVRVLVVAVALLLSAGALSAAVVDTPASTSNAADQAAGEPDVVTTTVAPDTTTSTTAAVEPATTSPPSTRLATTTTRRPSTATTAKPVTSSTVSVPRRPSQAVTTLPDLPPATSWQADKNGVSARVRIEPASPSAGQPVLFVIDVSSAQLCCIVLVSFGDGSATAANVTEVCSGTEPLTPGASTFETTHTYPAPGAYRATIAVDAGDACPQSAPPGGRVGAPEVIVDACFAVGPGTAGQAGCRPRPGA